MNGQKLIKVWDLPVRLFHWTLVAAFSIAYVTEDEFLGLHTFAGYSVIGLVLTRIIWGLVGTKYARFGNFVCSPSEVKRYLLDVVAMRAKRYIGHNPAGGAMVIALLISLFITTISGLVVYGSEELAGPLAETMRSAPHFIGNVAEDIHEFFANFTLLLVALHVVGVAIASLQHRENLIRSMFTGFKKPN